MIEKIKDKSAKVLLIEPNTTIQSIACEIIQEHGFAVIVANSLLEGLNLIASMPIDWILCPILDEVDYNSFQLLKICLKVNELKNTRVSFMLTSVDLQYTSKAIEFGLLSWMNQAFDKVNFKNNFSKMLQHFERHNWDENIIPAAQIASYLIEKAQFEKCFDFLNKMLKLQKFDDYLLLYHVYVCHKISKEKEAIQSFKQTCVLNDNDIEKTWSKFKSIIKDQNFNLNISSSDDLFNIKSTLIIDNDDASRNQMKSFLKNFGCENFVEFSNGQEAWDFIEKENENRPDFIIQEWAIPGLTGPYLLQRVRKVLPNIPVVVASSLVAKEDHHLLNEIGISAVIEKPFQKGVFEKKITHVLRQNQLPTEAKFLELKIRQSLAHNNLDEALIHNEVLQNDEKITLLVKKKMTAEISFFEKDFEKAKTLAIEIIHEQSDCLLTLNLLGKIMMVEKKFESARKCFEKAQTFNTKNIERICTLAEVQAELKNEGNASDLLAKAEQLDANSPVVQQAKVKVAVASGKTSTAKNLLSSMNNALEFISYMNNKAVSYAKSGHFKDGITEYQKTIEAIPNQTKEYEAVVLYNMALAQAKHGDNEEAQKNLISALSIKNQKIEKKAKSLLAKIENAMQNNTKITFSDDTSSRGKKNEAFDISKLLNEPKFPTIKVGEFCLVNIYTDQLEINDDVKRWLGVGVKFSLKKSFPKDQAA